MVKFAEAEKRRGGDSGGDRRMAPVALLERPKMSRGMWESLKSRILRERRRKKEEFEADEKEKRVRKERENQKKRHAMTLEETREQMVKEEQKLNNCQTQKHNLVQQLKKVLNEEKLRREQEKKQEEQQQLQFQHQQHAQQQSYVKESEIVPVHPYGHTSLPLSGHSQMMFPGGMVAGRPSNIPLYKMGAPNSQPLQNGNMKRSRSPSPPPQNYQSIPYPFKNLSGTQTSVVPVSVPATKPGGSGSSAYMNSQQSPYYHVSSQSHQSAQFQPGQTTQASIVSPYLTTPSAGHVSALHPSLDHKGKGSMSSNRSGSSFHPANDGGQDKFYVRPHLVLHPGAGVIPVQQSSAGVAKGGVALPGFAVRAPAATSQAPHSGSASHSYSGHPISRSYY